MTHAACHVTAFYLVGAHAAGQGSEEPQDKGAHHAHAFARFANATAHRATRVYGGALAAGVPDGRLPPRRPVIVEFDIPGVEPASIELTVEQNVLTVRAGRRFEPQQGDEVTVAERPQGTYARQVFLGDALDSERLQANCRHGVLTLRIPVAEAAKPRRVPVDGGQDAQTIEPADGRRRRGRPRRAARFDRRRRGAESGAS